MVDKKTVYRISEADYDSYADSYMGICLACGAWRDTVEPDATGYECEECGKLEVYGAEEARLMGRLVVED